MDPRMKQPWIYLAAILAAFLLVATESGYARPPAAQPSKRATSAPSAHRPAVRKSTSRTAAQKTKQAESLTLTKEERTLHTSLAKAEDGVIVATEKVRSAESALRTLDAEQKPILDQFEKLAQEKVKIEQELKKLLDGLWPLYVRQLVAAGQGLPSWEKADREFTWLSEVSKATGEKLEKAQQQQRILAQALKRKQEAVAKLKKQLVAVNKEKDKLLARKLELLRAIALVRKQKMDEENEVKEIIGVVQDLDYRLTRTLDGEKEESFGRLKGKLSWPTKGRIVQRFHLQAATPVRGLGLACEPGAKVLAVSWGKVVHDEVLRGFGRVIILMHDQAYYTLYAFLAKSEVSAGQDVDKGQELGEVGFYPQVNGVGLYFELRFHQKPINPEMWLAAH